MQRAALLGLECAFDFALVAPELPPFPCPPGLALWFHNALSNGFSQPNGHVRGPTRGIKPLHRTLTGSVKKIGFLSFGHWSPGAHSETRSAADFLHQSIDLAVAAEELGVDGAYFRVHHFAQQAGSPFPLLSAIGARTSKIEIGTGVIDMRYENPLYMAEDAGAADLISSGRLQLGISRGSPEQVIDGWRYFGFTPAEGETDADMARRHTEAFLKVIEGDGFAQPNPRPMFANPPGLLRVEPHSEGLRERIWWGSASNATGAWAAKLGMNLQSSTLKFDETGEPLHIQQRKQIEAYREAWKEAGHAREPRVSISRSIFALTNDLDRAYFGRDRNSRDQIGMIDENTQAIFGRSYAAEPDELIRQLKEDEAIQAADTLLLTIPNQLGVDYNAHVLETILTHVAPELAWR
jgi:alkanesulfonate monooxygenase SsuD/methylene tetrahydromethanopterin reductase-like flavin-dependent oxidoreductase (luciferase family)